MKITAIKQQVKNQDRYSIFIDKKYKLSLSTTQLVNANLHIDQIVSEAELEKLGDLAELSLAKNNSLRLLSYRARSSWEIEAYLKRKKYSDHTISETINFLIEKGFIDDLSFARQWVDNRLLLKQVSIKQLRQELKLKRIDNEIVEQILADKNVDEFDILKQLIEKKRQQTKYKDDLKLAQYLARKGFNYDKIKTALNSRLD
jgi:regulatory protein